jgi:hypothetical protein
VDVGIKEKWQKDLKARRLGSGVQKRRERRRGKKDKEMGFGRQEGPTRDTDRSSDGHT